MKTGGMCLTRPGHTWSSTCLTLKVVLGWLLTMLWKNPISILLLHGLWLGLVLSLRNVRSCGYLRMILRTRPRGHRPLFCFSVTSTPTSSASPSRRLTVSLSLPLWGMRVLSPILLFLSSPHRIGSPNRYSATGSPSVISNLRLRARSTLNI